MTTHRAPRIVAVLLMAGFWLGGLWLFLPDRGQAATSSKPGSSPSSINLAHRVPDSTPGQPQEPVAEWLALVRAAHKGPSSVTLGPVTMHLDMTSGYVAGRVPTGLPVGIEIFQAGDLVADITVIPVPDTGNFFYYGRPIRGGGGDPCIGGCYPYVMKPGDEVRVTQGGAFLTMTVPVLSALADSGTDQVYGGAPAFSEVSIYLFPESHTGVVFTQTVSAGPLGTYVADWSPGLDIRPQDSGYSVYLQDLDRQAYVRFFTPFLLMQVGADRVSGMAAPNEWVAITITTQSGAVLDFQWVYTGEDGRFAAVSGGSTGLLDLEPGYQVLASAGGQAFSATVGVVTAQADLENGLVSGQAAPGTSLAVLRHPGPLMGSHDELWFQPPVEVVTAVANSAGFYDALLALSPGNFGATVWTDIDGHQTYARYAVPQHHILLGGPLGLIPYSQLWGQVDAPGEIFTVEVEGPSGYLKDLNIETASDNGSYAFDSGVWNPSMLVLETGDVITITTPSRVEFSSVLPVLTAVADPDAGTVTGMAPPNSVLTVGINRGWNWADSPGGGAGLGGGGGAGGIPFDLNLVVTATTQGTYLADFGPLGGFDPLAYGEVDLALAQGHSAGRRFLGLTACPPYPYQIGIGLNSINFIGAPGCMEGFVRLRDSQGNLKAEASFISEFTYSYLELYDEFGEYIRILPGDMIEVDSGGVVNTEVVPNLSIQVDPNLNQVYGEAPAGQALEVVIWEQGYPYGAQVLTTTAIAQGEYLLDLDGILTLSAGDQVTVYTRPDLPWYFRSGGLPYFDASLYERSLYGWLPPLTPYTLTYSVSGELQQVITGVSSIGGFYYPGNPYIQPGGVLELTTPELVWPMTIPALSVNIDRQAGIISGQAPPSSTLLISVWDEYAYFGVSLETTADGDGSYSVEHPLLALMVEPHGFLYHYDSLGNQTQLEFSSFAWQVWLGTPCVSGGGGSPGTEVELTLESPDGLYQEVITSTAASYNGDFSGCFQRPVLGGSRLSFSDGVQNREFFVLDLQADYLSADQVIMGSAPPNAIVKVELMLKYFQFATRQARANGSGLFGLDLSDVDLDPWGYGNVIYEDRQQNTVYYGFSQAHQTMLPWIAVNPW